MLCGTSPSTLQERKSKNDRDDVDPKPGRRGAAGARTLGDPVFLYAPEAHEYLGSLFEDDAPCDSDGDVFVDLWFGAFVRDSLVQLAGHSSPEEAREMCIGR